MKNKDELLKSDFEDLTKNEQDKLMPYFGLDYCDICKKIKKDEDLIFLDTEENEDNEKIQNLLNEGKKVICSDCLESFESWRG